MRDAPINRIAVLGAGAWGTALANACLVAGREVMLWGRDAHVVAAINETRENPDYLPGVSLHRDLEATTEIDCISGCDAVLLVTPAQSTGEMAAHLAVHAPHGCPVILCAKGLDRATGGPLSDVIAAQVPAAIPVILSGPSFAADVARGLPTAVTVAAADEAVAAAVARALSSPTFRPYASGDPMGVQIGGALKNVLAIACGIVEGRKLGASARAALTARGFAELQRLGLAMGGRRETLTGLSGLGDLVLTCSSRLSRNFSFGIALGEGQTPAQLTGPGAKLVEGTSTASIAVHVAARYEVDIPISSAVDGVLAGRLTIEESIDALMTRPLRREDV